MSSSLVKGTALWALLVEILFVPIEWLINWEVTAKPWYGYLLEYVCFFIVGLIVFSLSRKRKVEKADAEQAD